MKKPIQIESITAVRAIDIKSVECELCEMPATLNANRHCKHCERTPRAKDIARSAARRSGSELRIGSGDLAMPSR